MNSNIITKVCPKCLKAIPVDSSEHGQQDSLALPGLLLVSINPCNGFEMEKN